MTHDDRADCPECSQAENRDVWIHIFLFVLLMVIGFAIGLAHG